MARRKQRTTLEQQDQIDKLNEMGMSQENIAQMVGRSQSYVSRYLAGRIPKIGAPAPAHKSSKVSPEIYKLLGDDWEAAIKGLCEMKGLTKIPTTLDAAAELADRIWDETLRDARHKAENERWEKMHPRSEGTKRTEEQKANDREIAARKDAKYQNEMPEEGDRSKDLPTWDKCLEVMGPNHSLTKRYMSEPQGNKPTLQYAIRQIFDPRFRRMEETASREMLPNTLKNIEDAEKFIAGSRSFREYVLTCYNETLKLQLAANEKVDPALEEFMKGGSEDGDEGENNA